MHGWRDAKGASIVAICDRDPERLQDRRRPVRHRAALCRCGRDDGEGEARLRRHRHHRRQPPARWSNWRPRTGCRRSAKSRSRRRWPTPRRWSTACDKAGVPLMVHENFRWQSPIQAVKAVLDSAARSASRSSAASRSAPATTCSPASPIWPRASASSSRISASIFSTSRAFCSAT